MRWLRPVLKKLSDMSAKLSDPAVAKQFAEMFYKYKLTYESHACYEDGILFPALEGFFPGLTEPVQQDHMKDSAAIQDLTALVAQLVPSVPMPSGEVSYVDVEYKAQAAAAAAAGPAGEGNSGGSDPTLIDRIQKATKDMAAGHLKHFELEEQHVAPVARKYLGQQFAKVLPHSV